MKTLFGIPIERGTECIRCQRDQWQGDSGSQIYRTTLGKASIRLCSDCIEEIGQAMKSHQIHERVLNIAERVTAKMEQQGKRVPDHTTAIITDLRALLDTETN